MIASVARKTIVAIMATCITVPSGRVSARDIFILECNVYVGPTRPVRLI